MRRLRAFAVVAAASVIAVLAAPAVGRAQETLPLVVGRRVAFRPPALPVSVICDDLSVVRVEDAGTFLWLTGLKPGATQCSFGSAMYAGRRALYRITVQPPP